MSKAFKGSDYLLLFLYLPGTSGEIGEPIAGRTRITKMMFLFKEEVYKNLNLYVLTPEIFLPDFDAYHFGPFSKDVYQWLGDFTKWGFIAENSKVVGYGNKVSLLSGRQRLDEVESTIYDQIEEDVQSEYCLTDMGKNFVRDKLLPRFDEYQINYLSMFKEKINTTSLNAILNYVYKKYPEYAKNSKIRDQVAQIDGRVDDKWL